MMEPLKDSKADTAIRSLSKQVAMECTAMASYAFRSGLKVPVTVMQTLEKLKPDQPAADNEIKYLVSAHVKLSELVAPATPRTIIFLGDAPINGNIFKFYSSVKIFRNIGITAAAFLISFILLSVLPSLGFNSETGDPLVSSGLNLLFNELYILTSAGIGATFAALFEANKYLVSCTFDPKYNYSYWIKIGLGLIAGFILAELIPIDDQKNSISILGGPTLAMLGGFSATVVHRILKRLVSSVESIFEGNTDQKIKNLEAANKIRNEENLSKMKLSHASSLFQLRQALEDDINSDQSKQMLDDLLKKLIPDE